MLKTLALVSIGSDKNGIFHEIDHCRICGNTQLVPILHLGIQYLTGVFPRNPSHPLTCGPLELVKCHGDESCGLVQLHHSYESREMYGDNYGYRSSLNQSMVQHLGAKVQSLLARIPLRNSDVVLDIGSNDGTLLSFYPSKLSRIGMDPTAARFREFYKPGIETITDFFSSEKFLNHVGGRKAKIITSIAMFYDLDEPISFVKQVASALDDDGIWHFEQSYLPEMLRQNAYDTICHEHFEYYGLRQVKWMLDRCGLKIIDIQRNDINGGSFAVSASKAGAPYYEDKTAVDSIINLEIEDGLDTLSPYQDFKRRVFEHRDKLLNLLDMLSAKSAKILGYGASTKGNVILQFCGLNPDRIPFMAEVNTAKFGSFTPGTSIPIISEADAHAMRPDYFLVMPWHFRNNLLQREAPFLARGGRMIFPLPEIEIVGR